MENVASNNIQSVIEHCPVFAGKNKEASCIYEIKFCICHSLYGKLVFKVLRSKIQSSYFLTDANSTPNVVAEQM